MKQCTKCKEEKPLTDFYAHKTSKGGLRGQCKKCFNGYAKNYHKANPEKIKVAKQLSYQRNKESYLKRAKEQHERGGEARRKQMREYAKAQREVNREEINRKSLESYHRNKYKKSVKERIETT